MEFNLRWIEALLGTHGRYLRENRGLFEGELRIVMKAVERIRGELMGMADGNVYMLEYLLSQPSKGKRGKEETKMITEGGGVNGGVGEEMEEEWIGLD